MKPIELHVSYMKGRPFAAYIHLERRPGEKSVRTQEFAPEIVVDFAEDDRPIGIEVITPEAVTVETVLEVFDALDLERPTPEEVAPCAAA